MQRKIKTVKQFSEKDCGPACLLSIIKYYNGYIPLEKIKFDCNTDITGTTAYDLIKTGNKYGFDSAGYHINKNSIFESNRIFPMICHVKEKNLLHYIVLYQINSRRAIIMDPAKGRRILKLNEFFDIWTGNILEFYPRKEITILKTNNTLYDIFINILNKESKIIIKLFIINILLVITTIIASYYFKIVMDNISSDMNLLKYISSFFLIIIIMKCIFNNIKNYYSLHINKNLDIYLYKDFIEHIYKLPSKIMQSKTMGEIITRINDLTQVKTLFSDIIISFFLDLILTLIALPILIMIDYKLFIILLFIILSYLLIGIFFSKIIHKKIIYNKELESDFNTNIYESILMNNNLKNLNKVNKALLKSENIICNYLLDSFKCQKIYNTEKSIKFFIDEIGIYLIYTIGFYNVIYNNMNISDLILYTTLMNFFLNPIKNFTNNIPKYNFIKASIHKLNEFMNIEREKEEEKQKIYNWSIKVDNISFSYNGFKNIINNISFEINSNEHVFITGKSGGGKSTICKLLIKNELIENGNILYGNNNINDITIKTIRENIIYISQKEYLISDTIKENIIFHNDVDQEKFNYICKLCRIDDILINKALRYDSHIEMDSSNFSGGEKQRLVLARACLNNFNILIIDEALSEVDLKTEKEIIKNLKQYFSNKIIIYISHKNVKNLFKKVINIE